MNCTNLIRKEVEPKRLEKMKSCGVARMLHPTSLTNFFAARRSPLLGVCARVDTRLDLLEKSWKILNLFSWIHARTERHFKNIDGPKSQHEERFENTTCLAFYNALFTEGRYLTETSAFPVWHSENPCYAEKSAERDLPEMTINMEHVAFFMVSHTMQTHDGFRKRDGVITW